MIRSGTSEAGKALVGQQGDQRGGSRENFVNDPPRASEVDRKAKRP